MLWFIWLFAVLFNKQTTKTPDHNLNKASWTMKMYLQASWNVTVFKHWISLEKQTNVWQLTENVHINQIQTDLRYLIGNVPMRRLPHVGILTTFAQHVWYTFWSSAGVVMLTHSIEYLNISQGKAILHIYWYTVDIYDNHLKTTTSLWLQTWVVAIGYLCTHQTWFNMIARLEMKCKITKYKIETYSSHSILW